MTKTTKKLKSNATKITATNGDTPKAAPVKAESAKPALLQPELTKLAPAKPAPAKNEPIKAAPVKSAPVATMPPIKAAFAKAAPVVPLVAATPAAVKVEPTKPAAVPAPVKVELPKEPRVALQITQPGAKTVSVAGSFNGWNPAQTPLKDAGNGKWVGELTGITGRHEYLFVVDGQWLPDPNAKETVQNPFGGRNSVLVVSA